MSDATMETQDTWPIDESWIPAQDESLEAFVRSWVMESSKAASQPEAARLNIKWFPAEVLNAMEYLHGSVEVEAVGKDGSPYRRHPNYGEVYAATALCGLRCLQGHNPSTPPRMERLEQDDTQATTRRVVMFVQNGILSPRHERLQARLPVSVVAQARDLSDLCSIHTSAVLTACFVAGVSQSDDWLIPHGRLRSRWVSRCGESVRWFWQMVETERGLW